ncbi:MAG: hypothetical protein K6U89_05810 [Chloroflexi bacterium]|nr:hypothetical protein [Chloroflexota bacterium]
MFHLLKRPLAVVLSAATFTAFTLAPVANAQAACQYVLGFAEFQGAIPTVVGQCAGPVVHNAQGDGYQLTANGVLVWRKATNFTGFSDGSNIWYATPTGVRAVRAGAAADLREALSKLLSEHAFLAAVAMQKGYDGAPDFPAAAAQLDQNSLALAAAISSVYGEAAGQQFLVQWREHIRMFVDFTVGTATKDEAKRRQALAELAAYRTSFAAFLNTANPFLPQEAAAGLLQEHIGQLSTALDSYVQGNYAQTYRLISESHSHMFMTGTGLAGAIVKQFPDRFIPSGM